MRRSSDLYREGELVQGFDYDLQAWVRDGVVLSVGLNAASCSGLPWLQARVRAFGRENHLERLKITLEDVCPDS